MKYSIYWEKAMLYDKILIEINELLEKWYSKWWVSKICWFKNQSELTNLMSWKYDCYLKTLHKVYNWLTKDLWNIK